MFAAIAADEGSGVAKDEALAAAWFAAAAHRGAAKAQFSLGIRFAEGRGATRTLRAASPLAASRAPCSTSRASTRGPRHGKDDVAALAWCTKAADLGDGTAMVARGVNLAAIYAQGRGVAADGDAARKWLDAATLEPPPGWR
ncbi:hypothetical protein JL720_16391 [Aureococcus anophagefferens]|nr:hypothetical protein JL720_16391 [Aureococcus anophagefferens]